jgi:hypothetical protein
VPTPSLAKYVCGSSNGIAATTGTADGLENDVPYTVAVAAVDLLENPGPLSGQSCATPQAVTDFFELYRQAGGSGGGGICSIAHAHRGEHGAAFTLSGIAALLVMRRRMRRR